MSSHSILSTAVDLLKTVFGDRAITPDLETYNALHTQPWSQTCWQPAACYVKTNSVEDVSAAIKAIKQTGCKFAVRSTGHNPNPGFSSTDELGVVLDLSGLLSRELTEDKEVARIGAGNRWGDVYRWLEGEGRSVVGGRDTEVGMGFLLGGGYGAVPNIYGLGADNVVNFEVVLHDGKIINANAKENTDLYRALKGGGTNFGIITRFDIKTHPLTKLKYSIKLYNPADYMVINKATVALQDAMEEDPQIGMFTNYNPFFVAVGLVYANGNGTEYDALDRRLFGLLPSPMNEPRPTTEGTFLSLAQALGHATPDPKKYYVGTLTTKYTEPFYADVYHAWQEMLPQLPRGALLHYTIQPLGRACVQYGHAMGGNILGLEACGQCWWVFTAEWAGQSEDHATDNAVRSVLDSFVQRVGFSARVHDVLLDHIPANFATAKQDPLRSYGARNVEEMQTVAGRYDPEGLFQKQQVGGFLLRGASGI